jgi:hypothetical protein
VTPGEDSWLIDSSASKHMTGQKDILSNLTEKDFPQKVSLGDDYQYPIKGIGESAYKLDLGTPMRMKDVLYVPGLTKNLLSISALDKKGFRVAFIDGKVLMWPKGKIHRRCSCYWNRRRRFVQVKRSLRCSVN